MHKKTTKLFIGLFLLVIQITLAQNRTIAGSVTDDSGLPLPGANVFIENKSGGTVSDFDGKFVIEVADTDTLVISYIGYVTQNILVGDKSTIKVQLLEDTESLQEVVVTAQGIVTEQKTLTYAISKVGGDQISKSKEVNLVSALAAKAPGVAVTSSSGSVGASANIRIRGNTSISRNNSPLFVIDGIPIDNSSTSEDPTQSENNSSLGGVDFSNRVVDLNPDDIASVTVLKGVAAQSLYGLRAGNGVIIITTKRAKTGKPNVSISFNTMVSEINKVPELQREFAQGGFDADAGTNVWRGPETFEGDSWGPRVSQLEYDGDTSYPFDPRGRLVPLGTGNGQLAKTFDHYDFFKKGLLTEVNVSVSGGTEALRYRLSTGRLDQDGVSPSEEFRRETFRLNLDSDLSKKFSINSSAQFSKSGGNRVQRGSNISGIMLGLTRTTPTFDNGNGSRGNTAAGDPSSYFYDIPGQELPGPRSYRNGVYNNPYFTVARNSNIDDVKRFIGNLGFKYDLTDWLFLKATGSVDTFNDRRTIGFDRLDANNPNGRLITDAIDSEDVNWNALLHGNNTLSEKFSVDYIFGADGYDGTRTRRTVIGDGLTIPGLFNLANAESVQAFESTDNRRRLLGAFMTTTLNFNDIVYLNGSLRNDWSSTLPKNDNNFLSYSVGGNFLFSELIDKSFLNLGKLRLSYGKTGNDAFEFAVNPVFTSSVLGGDGFVTGLNFPAYDTVSFEPASVARNQQLEPEETTEFEIGLDLGFLNNRIKTDFTYYNKETKGQIVQADVAASTGANAIIRNTGLISNEGFEVSLGIKPVELENFSWAIDANWTTYENIVEELDENTEFITLNGFSSTSSVAIEGESFGAIYGNGFLRNEDGEVLINDDGFPIRDPENKVVGDPIPDWTAGISNTFTFKNVSLSVLFDIRQGGDVWCGTCGILDYFGTSARTLDRETSRVFEGIVQSTGQRNTQSVQLFDTSGNENLNFYRRYGFGGLSESSVYDSSWVRLRELTISYSFNSKQLQGTFLNGLSLSAYGRNLWLKTDFPGIDPETNLTGDSNGSGLEYFNQPNTRSYGFNIKLNF